jgi:DNA (cytosine-5)-methyltransferase 1
MKPKLLDLFCCQGGAAAGYVAAGFDVVGVDLEPQPRYPYPFHQGDALAFLLEHGHLFDAFHGSPPCQAFTAYRRRDPSTVGATALDLVDATRQALRATGKPTVIENVVGAPLRADVVLCGSMFGLGVRRHRVFELGGFTMPQLPCRHHEQRGSYPCATNRTNPRRTCEVGVYRIPLATQKAAMGGCAWMDLDGLSQAVPPAYTETIGRAMLAAWRRAG